MQAFSKLKFAATEITAKAATAATATTETESSPALLSDRQCVLLLAATYCPGMTSETVSLVLLAINFVVGTLGAGGQHG